VTKTCPHCSADVIEAANLCKHCFHDFRAVKPAQRSPLVILAGALLATGLVAVLGFTSLRDKHRATNIHADQETKRFVIVTTTPTGREVKQVAFADIAAVEYNKAASPEPFEVSVVTTDGRRQVLRNDSEGLDAVAQGYAAMLGQKLVVKGDVDLAPAAN
jgi:hypothetical protein